MIIEKNKLLRHKYHTGGITEFFVIDEKKQTGTRTRHYFLNDEVIFLKTEEPRSVMFSDLECKIIFVKFFHVSLGRIIECLVVVLESQFVNIDFHTKEFLNKNFEEIVK